MTHLYAARNAPIPKVCCVLVSTKVFALKIALNGFGTLTNTTAWSESNATIVVEKHSRNSSSLIWDTHLLRNRQLFDVLSHLDLLLSGLIGFTTFKIHFCQSYFCVLIALNEFQSLTHSLGMNDSFARPNQIPSFRVGIIHFAHAKFNCKPTCTLIQLSIHDRVFYKRLELAN